MTRRHSDDEDGEAELEAGELQSRTVTPMQFAAYRLHERVNSSNDFLRWGFLFQVTVLTNTS